MSLAGPASAMSVLRGVLFDLDGTLADTAAAERSSWPDLVDVLRAGAPAIDADELHDRYYSVFEPHWTAYLQGEIDFTTYRRRRLADALEPWSDLDDELFEAYRSEKRRTVERLVPFPDTFATLGRVRASGLRAGLLTNGPSELQRRKLAVTGLERVLDAIAVSEEIGIAKPDARAFKLAAAMIGCEPAAVAMVGDSPRYDIEGAIGAGIARAVLVTNGLETSADGATVIRTLAELPDVLGLGGDASAFE